VLQKHRHELAYSLHAHVAALGCHFIPDLVHRVVDHCISLPFVIE
jgi:hypothetical protein